MRKALILFAILLAAGIGGMCYAHATLTASQYDVSFTETDFYGDLSAADGLTVSVQAHLAQHLLWDSAHSFGRQPETKTDVLFSSSELRWQSLYTPEALSLNMAIDFSSATSNGDLLGEPAENPAFGQTYAGVDEILRDVASRTANGEERSETVRLNDYFDYYPIRASIYGWENAKYYFEAYSGKMRYTTQFADEQETREAFSSYLKIPVLQEHMVTIGITKDSTGNVVEMSMSQGYPIYLYTVSVDTKDGVYFALCTDGVTDFSNIPGGFGIYLLPASTVTDDDGKELPTLDYWNLQTVYPLSESAPVLSLELSEDESCLNLITTEDNVLYLTVIELATMTEKQKLPLFEGFDDVGLQTISYTDGFMFALLGDSRFALAELRDDNTYKIALTGTRENELSIDEYYRWYEPKIAWNGESLALVTGLRRLFYADGGDYVGYSRDVCGFMLEIYDESGLKYEGAYESSLDVLAADENYSAWCHLIDTGGLSASW